ncbi:putative MccF-like protein (microcin C7 resistance) [Galbibacter orientalis DSM 19592]|uniref:Putative MccF-like protein (Microcin C7 resistance) n=1 Tax=Galbibacter orientalis DSM 19592 TaxID=926559 RepID=I3C730_9FLAO|nr:LD-carboxypeptidase [Galbibacter orientalis]EIJ39423.1 putative MccF-like protein (microcin C7 resistance) [Galbibacter orientalis DSM 19592]
MNRRKFITRSVQASALTAVPVGTIFAQENTIKPIQSNVILPKKLKKGAKVGLIAPGYALSDKALQNAITNVKAMGYEPFYTSRISGNYGYFSNTDIARVEDIHEMFLNPAIDAIFCARGGYGCTRILKDINFDYIQQNPKILLGFSDITALVNSIYQKTGIVTFHGPVGTTLDNQFNRTQLERIIEHTNNSIQLATETFPASKTLADSTFENYVITSGTATGKLVGGNLSLLSAMTGTDFDVDYTDKIVFIEEIDEDPYRVDRMLTQLLDSKTFKHAKGIVLGVFKGCDDPKRANSFSLKEVILDRLKPMNIPCVYGFPIGHVDHNITLPVGIEARLNTQNYSLELLKNSVS